MASRSKFIPGKDAKAAIRSAAQRGVGLATEELLGNARKEVPHDVGTLELSGRASRVTHGSETTGAVAFDQPYAVDQHESMHYRHKKGRKAKYLEDPLNAGAGKFREIIASELRGEL